MGIRSSGDKILWEPAWSEALDFDKHFRLYKSTDDFESKRLFKNIYNFWRDYKNCIVFDVWHKTMIRMRDTIFGKGAFVM